MNDMTGILFLIGYSGLGNWGKVGIGGAKNEVRASARRVLE